MALIYLDACFLIYEVESTGPHGQAARAALAAAEPSTRFAVSPLVEMECLVGPLKSVDLLLETSYRQAIADREMLAIPAEAYALAARLRATTSVKTPDALHWATAQLSGCDQLWTGDADFAAAAPGFVRDVLAT
jgi:predicted nucleic acid-binding protein